MSRDIQRPKVYVSEATSLAVKENLRRHEHKLATDPDYAKSWSETMRECLVEARLEAEKRQRNSEISFELRHTPIGPLSIY